MAKFSQSLLFVLGVAAIAALTLGQEATVASPSNPLDGLTQLLSNPEALNAALQCAPMCASACSVLKTACVDIPGLVDCAALSSQCDTQCADLCSCMDTCQSSCDMNQDCDDAGSIVCVAQNVLCSSQCQINCPGTKMIEGLNAALQSITSQVNAIIGNMGVPAPVDMTT